MVIDPQHLVLTRTWCCWEVWLWIYHNQVSQLRVCLPGTRCAQKLCPEPLKAGCSNSGSSSRSSSSSMDAHKRHAWVSEAGFSRQRCPVSTCPAQHTSSIHAHSRTDLSLISSETHGVDDILRLEAQVKQLDITSTKATVPEDRTHILSEVSHTHHGMIEPDERVRFTT